MISLGTLALLGLIAVIPAGLGFLAGHVNGTASANKRFAKRLKDGEFAPVQQAKPKSKRVVKK